MTRAALLGSPVLFGAAAHETAPLPIPDSPERIVSQLAAFSALQAQFGAVITWTIPLAPPAAADADVG
jgi:hypothetical protein